MSNGIADMLFKIEAAKALYYRAASEAKLKPTHEMRQRARAAHIMIQRNCVEFQEAIKVCGGRHTQAVSAGAVLARCPGLFGDAAVDAEIATEAV